MMEMSRRPRLPLRDMERSRESPSPSRNMEIEGMIRDIVSNRQSLDAEALTTALRALPRRELDRLHRSLNLGGQSRAPEQSR
jgi:hypothetical protein